MHLRQGPTLKSVRPKMLWLVWYHCLGIRFRRDHPRRAKSRRQPHRKGRPQNQDTPILLTLIPVPTNLTLAPPSKGLNIQHPTEHSMIGLSRIMAPCNNSRNGASLRRFLNHTSPNQRLRPVSALRLTLSHVQLRLLRRLEHVRNTLEARTEILPQSDRHPVNAPNNPFLTRTSPSDPQQFARGATENGNR